MTKYEKYIQELGVELNQPFHFKFEAGDVSSDTYKFTKKGLANVSGNMTHYGLDDVFIFIMTGKYTIVKPFPQIGDIYYYPLPSIPCGFGTSEWEDDHTDHIRRDRVGVFETKEEVRAELRELGWI